MKKEELKKIIEARIILNNYYGNKKFAFGTALKDFERIDDETIWFPEINGLREELEILKNEIKDTINKKNEAIKLFKEYKCKHEVRISDYDFNLTSQYNDTCVLCGKKFGNSVINTRNTMNNMAYKNQKIATFIGKENVTPNGFFMCEESITHYNQDEILQILLNITKSNEKDMDAEIDIVEEIEKLNLKKCIVNKPHNKKLILILTGCNKEFIDDYYITKKNTIEENKIIEYFKNLYGVSLEIIGDEGTIDKYRNSNDSIILSEYDTIKELEMHLNFEKQVPFNLIIDLSNLFSIRLDNNKIELLNYKLYLENIFPNIPIINIHDFSKENKETMKNFLENNTNNNYGYKSYNYYHIKNNNLEEIYPNNFCDKIKKLIK